MTSSVVGHAVDFAFEDVGDVGKRAHHTRVEGAQASFQRFQAHGTGNIGDGAQFECVIHREQTNSGHGLCAIDQRQPFFGF